MEEKYGIASYRSRQQVLALERALRREGVITSVVTTPREVAMGCGLSLKFDLKDAQTVKRAVSRADKNNLVGVYGVENARGRMRLTPINR